MKNTKGFTLVELLAILIVLVIFSLMALFAVNRIVEKGKKKAFLREANNIAKAAVQKYFDDKELKPDLRTDLYNGTVPGKVCYSISDNLIGKYVNVENNNKYTGSVEVCYKGDCASQYKIWINNGDVFYINGKTKFDSLSAIDYSTSEEYFNSCGYETIGSSVGTSTIAEFDYTGDEQKFTVLKNGSYRIEAWGAQGGDYSSSIQGGYGAYAVVDIDLKKGNILYINVGGKGPSRCINGAGCSGGFNGGAKSDTWVGGGGGATHVATVSGRLYNVPISHTYVIAGGGGGGTSTPDHLYYHNAGGYTVAESGFYDNCQYGKYGLYGGYKPSNDSYRGRGAGYSSSTCGSGTASDRVSGGTSYVFNPLTKNGKMYCYDCPQTYTVCCYSSQPIDYSTARTTASHMFSEDPISTYAKVGNGHVRISFISDYQIAYNLNGGSLANDVTNPTYYSEDDATITLNNPSKTNYNFIGWNDGTNLFDRSSTPYKTSTYIKGDGEEVDHAEYSIYQMNILPNTSYTIVNSGKSTAPGYAIFDSSDNYITGDGYRDRSVVSFTTPSNASYIRMSVVTQTSSNRYDRKKFKLEKPNLTQTIPTGSTGDKTFDARYVPLSYTITYNLDGGVLGEGVSNPTSYNYESANFTLNNPTKEGYTFAGWTGTNGETPQTSITINKGSTDNRTYTANYTAN